MTTANATAVGDIDFAKVLAECDATIKAAEDRRIELFAIQEDLLKRWLREDVEAELDANMAELSKLVHHAENARRRRALALEAQRGKA